MMSDIVCLADVRRPPAPSVDRQLFETFLTRIGADGRHEADLRHRMGSLEQAYVGGDPIAARYVRIIESKMRKPLRPRHRGEEVYERYVDASLEVSVWLYHWTGRHSPADHFDPPTEPPIPHF